MGTKPNGFSNHLAMGNAILARLGKKFPPAMKDAVKGFQEAHARFETEAAEADAVRADRDGALQAIARADNTLDKSVLELANVIVAAGLGARKNPFADFSRHPPAQMVDLAYLVEVREVEALLTNVNRVKAKAGPAASKELARIIGSCARDVRAVKAAVGAFARPQTIFHEAVAARDAHLLDWTRALSRLKKHAAVAWAADPAAYRALFAEVDGRATAKKRAPTPRGPRPSPSAPPA